MERCARSGEPCHLSAGCQGGESLQPRQRRSIRRMGTAARHRDYSAVAGGDAGNARAIAAGRGPSTKLHLHLFLVQRKKEKQGAGISPEYKAKEYARHRTKAKFLGGKEFVSKRLTSHSESIFLAGVLGWRPSETKAWAPLSLPSGLCQSGLPGEQNQLPEDLLCPRTSVGG